MQIEISNDDWKGATVDNIMAVLTSSADALATAIGAVPPPLLVKRWDEPYPMVDFVLDSGRRVIRLTTGGHYWSQYAYQFSHELCHVLANFEKQPSPTHKWLEESICELASIYVLRRMAETWATKPPYDNWRDDAPKLKEYADGLLRYPPNGEPFQEWLRREATSLEKDSCQREKNSIVASHLLPLFEENNGYCWKSVGFMNLWRVADDPDMNTYFRHWRAAAGQELDQAICRIAAVLDFVAD